MDGNASQVVTLFTRLAKIEGFPGMEGTHENDLCEFSPFLPVPRVREEDGRRITLGPDRRIEVELPPEIRIDRIPDLGYIEVHDPTPRIETTSVFGGPMRPISGALDIYQHVRRAIEGGGPAPEGFRIVSNELLDWQEG